jgi:hypothetical protein
LFTRVAEVTGADAGAFQTVYDYREGRELAKDSFVVYDQYIHALEKVIIALDGIVPKKQWQRVAQ